MTNSFLTATAAAALLMTASCGNASQSGSTSSSQSAPAVAPEQVTPDELRSAVSGEREKAFYEARGWKAVWNSEQAGQLVEALRGSQAHGLENSQFLRAIEQADGAAAREAAMTEAALAYADALADGVANPEKLREVYTVPRPKANLLAGLSQAVQSGNVGQWLASLAPQDAEYRALSEAYLQQRRQAAQEQAQGISDGDLIKLGDSDPRVPRLAEALRSNGYLERAPQPDTHDPNLYTPELAAAVKQLQDSYGISADGVVGAETLKVLNTGAADRARQLAVNLERRRWLERQAPQTRIDVNTAAAHLDYWRDGSHTDQRRVVVGQPDWETPPLGSPMFRLVANPNWTVPKSIEEEEIAPKGAAYLRRNNMVRRNGWIVQLPGPDNALGQVKFDMQNDQAIYLHDTPAKALFNQNERHSSHGCVRVQDALGFARMLAEHDGISAEFEKAMATGEETFVSLENNIPVRLLYHTAFTDRTGNVVFRTDAYGWDEDVAKALGLEAGRARQVRSHAQDIGP